MWTRACLLALSVPAIAWWSISSPASIARAEWRTRNQEGERLVPTGSGRLVYDEHRRRVVLLDAAAPSSTSKLTVIRSWTWNGRGWVPLAGDGPAWRVANAAVYDAHRRRIVIFGGATIPATASSDETWETDGRTWSLMDRSSTPGRDHHAMTYDSARHRTVLFGGGTFARGTPYRLRNDTWEWDGSEWRQAATDGPGVRRLPGMAYDGERQQVVLFGGVGARSAADTELPYFGDTWVWNGEAWRQVADSGPPPRYGHAMTFDSRTRTTLMYGGNTVADQPLADLWQWDGRRWTEITLTGPGPGARFGAAMAYDAARQRAVLFGGRRDDTRTWEWDGRRWEEIGAANGNR